MAKTVLLYTGNNKKREQIESLCKKMNIALKSLKSTDINLPIGGFFGLPLNAKPKQTAPVLYNPPELMIINGMDDNEIEVFLDKYKEQGIETIPLKGTTTPYNITWSPYEFILEYQKEQGLIP